MITKDMTIDEILNQDERIANILLNSGMPCLGCPSARSETLAEACEHHEIDCDKILSEINNLV